MRRAVSTFALALAACHGDDPAEPQPVAASALAGTYRVTLASGGGQNPAVTCPAVTATVGGAWASSAAACAPVGGVSVSADTVRLAFSSGSLRPLLFAQFTGTPASARATWVGGTCKTMTPGAGLCVREAGTATWVRQ